MAYSFVLRDIALEEFSEAFIWYEQQQNGLGKIFRRKIFDKLKKVCNNPLHYKKTHKQFHEALVDKFPFLIVYSIDEEAHLIIVFAIFHTSRNPRKKFNRK